jgi:hypothetical protein
MQTIFKKTMAVLTILVMTISMSAVLFQTANAHTPPWTIVSYAYIVVAPNPIGVGQSTAINLWVDTPV